MPVCCWSDMRIENPLQQGAAAKVLLPSLGRNAGLQWDEIISEGNCLFFYVCALLLVMIKLRYCEEATKLKKNLPLRFDVAKH